MDRFEQNFLRECSYRLSEGCKCRLFWHGVPFSISARADYNFRDYSNLKIEGIRAEREMLHDKRIEENLEENRQEENSGVRIGEPVRTIEEDSEEDLEENPEENPDQNSDENAN